MTPNGPRCPKCGGTQFEGTRSIDQKINAVLFVPSMLAKKKDIACVTCGAKFSRG